MAEPTVPDPLPNALKRLTRLEAQMKARIRSVTRQSNGIRSLCAVLSYPPMNRRSRLDTARRHLVAHLRRVMDRIIIDRPLSEAERRRAQELAKEHGWDDEIERLRKRR